GRVRRAQQLRAARRRVDERFDPRKALAATARYLTIARERLGRDDLAVASYHMGIGNLREALSLYGAPQGVPYAQLYLDATASRPIGAWARAPPWRAPTPRATAACAARRSRRSRTSARWCSGSPARARRCA